MDSSSGKKEDRISDKIKKADSWATYKLRSARSRSVQMGARPVEDPEAAASDSDLSESESEGTRTSRSSARLVSSAMEKFCEGKKKAVREIGYGGLLHIPLINKVNLKFTTWVLSRIDVETRSMPVGKDGRVFLSPEHVEKVIGVPSRGRQVCGLEPDNAQERSDFVRLAMGATQFCNNPLKAAQSVVMREWKGNVTADMVDEFKVAFVVWINGRFLAPTTKHDLGCSDFWGSLYITGEIKEFNWGAYYLDHMMEAAARVQSDMKLKKTTILITSCPLLAKIIYLDNIDLGTLSKPHTLFPRILDFDSETLINKMIMEDKHPGHVDSWGTSKARLRENSCYMASETGQPSSSHIRRPGKEIEKSSRFDEGTVGSPFSPSVLRPFNGSDFCEFLRQEYPDMMDSDIVDHLKYHNARCILHSNIFKDSIIRENMRLAARLLGKHSKQKHSSKASRRGREDYLSASESETENDNKRSRLNKNSMPASLSFGSVTPTATKQLDPSTCRSHMRWPNIPGRCTSGSNTIGPSIDPATVDQDNEFPSFDLGVFSPEKTSMEQAPHTQPDAVPPIHDLTDNEADAMTTPAPKLISPYTETVIYSECALAAKWDISPKYLNLNARALAADYSHSPIIKRSVKPGKFARSPWAMGVKHPARDQELTHSLYDWISSTASTELERAWVVHNNPRYIEVDGLAMKIAITCVECWGYDVFDIAIRRIQQLDRAMYPVGLLWRLIFESDFAMHVLGNADPFENVPVRSQLTGDGVEFEIQRCRQIIIPVRSPRSWCAYAWDMKLQKTKILDPMAALSSEDQTLDAHRLTIERLHAALANCIELCFDGWTPKWQDWEISVVKSDNLTSTPEQSALYTLFNIINFDGQKYAAEPTPEAINNFKEKILYEMMSIEDNKGKVPSIFVHTIED